MMREEAVVRQPWGGQGAASGRRGGGRFTTVGSCSCAVRAFARWMARRDKVKVEHSHQVRS